MRPLLTDEQVEALAQQLAALDGRIAWARLKGVPTTDKGLVWTRRQVLCFEAKWARERAKAEQRKQQAEEHRQRMQARRRKLSV